MPFQGEEMGAIFLSMRPSRPNNFCADLNPRVHIFHDHPAAHPFFPFHIPKKSLGIFNKALHFNSHFYALNHPSSYRHYSGSPPGSRERCCTYFPLPSASSPHIRIRDLGEVPYEHLSQHTRHLLINPLLRARKLDIHVAIDAHETALVFCLAPFETDYYVFVYPIPRTLASNSILYARLIFVALGCFGGRGGWRG